MLTTVRDVRLLQLSKLGLTRATTARTESSREVPFDIARVYYVYDVPAGESRGGHAHRELEEVLVAAGGAFDVVVDDGASRNTFTLNRAYEGLYIPKMIWRDLSGFASGSVCLVITSLPYTEKDYIRDYGEFLGARDDGRTIP